MLLRSIIPLFVLCFLAPDAKSQSQTPSVAECPGLPTFRRFSNVELRRDSDRRLVAAARRWLSAKGQDPASLFAAIASDGDDREIHVVDEAECNAEPHFGCAGKFCATLIYEAEHDAIERAVYWR